MTIEEFQQMCMTTRNKLCTSQIELATWLMIEAAELSDHILKNSVYGRPIDQMDFLNEAGDVLHLLQSLLTSQRLTLGQAMIVNKQKMVSRGWIEGGIDG